MLNINYNSNMNFSSIYKVKKPSYQTLFLIFESRKSQYFFSRLGAWVFAQSFGNCLGPWIGGVLVQYLQPTPINPANLDPANSDYGFRATTMIFLCVFNISMFLIDSCTILYKWLKDRQSETRRQGYEIITGA